MGGWTNQSIAGGGTVNGALTITGNLTVQGQTTSVINQTINGTVTIDLSHIEALLVRKDVDGGDIFTVDTSNDRVGVGGAPAARFNVIQTDDTNIGGLRVVNSAGSRVIVMWADAANLAHLDSGLSGTAPLTINSGGGAVTVGGDNTIEGTVDIQSGAGTLLGGADDAATTRTDATNKSFRVGSVHYTNAEEPSTVYYAFNTITTNEIRIGGSTVTHNAATEISFWTAANNISTTGTQRVTIDSAGDAGFGIGSSLLGQVHIDQSDASGAQPVLYLDQGDAAEDVIQAVGASLTTGDVLQCTDAGALTTGSFLRFNSNSSDTTSRNLAAIVNDNAAATGATCLALRQDAAHQVASLNQTATASGSSFIDFQGTAAADATGPISTFTTSGSVTHHIQIEINGVKAWIPCSTSNPF